MFAHENSRVRVVEQVAREVRHLQDNFFNDSRIRWVGTRMARPGEASSALTNFQAAGAPHGRRITRGWVVTRKNS